MNEPVVYDRKIRFSDSDAQGIVHNAAYLVYWDDAFTDYMEAIGCPWKRMTDAGDDVVLARTEIDYRASAGIGDTARTLVKVTRIGSSSITFHYRTVDVATGETLVEGVQIQVIVDHETFQPKRVPDYIREMIAAWEGPELDLGDGR